MRTEDVREGKTKFYLTPVQRLDNADWADRYETTLMCA